MYLKNAFNTLKVTRQEYLRITSIIITDLMEGKEVSKCRLCDLFHFEIEADIHWQTFKTMLNLMDIIYKVTDEDCFNGNPEIIILNQ